MRILRTMPNIDGVELKADVKADVKADGLRSFTAAPKILLGRHCGTRSLEGYARQTRLVLIARKIICISIHHLGNAKRCISI
jgi:hypothetical protein